MTGAGADPGATMNGSMLKRPMKFPTALPTAFVSMSPWYQDRPKGALGTWITKTSNSVFGGKPTASMFMTSTGPSELIVACAKAEGMQLPAAALADRTMENE